MSDSRGSEGRRALALLAYVNLMYLLGWSSYKYFVPLYLKQVGAPVASLGLLFAGISFSSAAGAYLWGRLVDRLGGRASLSASLTLSSLLVLSLTYSHSWLALSAIFLLLPLAQAGRGIAAQVLAFDHAAGKRATGMSLVFLPSRAALIVGPSVGGALISCMGGYRAVFSVASALMGLSLLGVILLPPGARQSGYTMSQLSGPGGLMSTRLRDLLRGEFGAYTVASALGRALSYSLLGPYLVVYMKDVLGMDEWLIGAANSLESGLALATQVPGGLLADRLGLRRSLVALSFASYPASLALIYVSRGPWLAVLGKALSGSVEGIAAGAELAYQLEILPEDRRGEGLGLYRSVHHAASALGNVSGGALLLRVGEVARLFPIGILLGVAGVAAFLSTGGVRRGAAGSASGLQACGTYICRTSHIL